MDASKPRVIKDFEKLDPAIQEQIKLAYPEGFEQGLIQYYNKEGKKVLALPFETDEKYYMVRMTLMEAQELVEDDEDYDDEGNLKDDVKEEYESKYGDLSHMADYLSDSDDDDDDETGKQDDVDGDDY